MNGQHHVDMKYSIPKPSSKIKPKSKIRDFVVMTAATAIMACGIYFSNLQIILHSAVLQVLRSLSPRPEPSAAVILTLSATLSFWFWDS